MSDPSANRTESASDTDTGEPDSAANSENSRSLLFDGFKVRRIAFVLACSILSVAVVGATSNYLIHNVAPSTDHPIADVLKRFDLGHEPSIPAYFSSLLMLSAALALFLLAKHDPRPKPIRRFWLLMGILFVALAVDEVVMFHEMGTAAMNNVVSVDGIYFTWIIPGALFAGTIGVLSLPYLKRIGKRTGLLVLLAGTIFVGGALGLEFLAGLVFIDAGDDQLAQKRIAHIVLQAMEETMEMAGVSIFFCALLDYANRSGIRISVWRKRRHS